MQPLPIPCFVQGDAQSHSKVLRNLIPPHSFVHFHGQNLFSDGIPIHIDPFI
jgi:hypothetical protein